MALYVALRVPPPPFPDPVSGYAFFNLLMQVIDKEKSLGKPTFEEHHSVKLVVMAHEKVMDGKTVKVFFLLFFFQERNMISKCWCRFPYFGLSSLRFKEFKWPFLEIRVIVGWLNHCLPSTYSERQAEYLLVLTGK
jgi:hypothetical protein